MNFLVERLEAFMQKLFLFLVGAAALAQNAPDHPSVTAQGKTFTPRSVLARNMGTPEDQTTALPPHKIVDNIYYVGTKTRTQEIAAQEFGSAIVNRELTGLAESSAVLEAQCSPRALIKSPFKSPCACSLEVAMGAGVYRIVLICPEPFSLSCWVSCRIAIFAVV